MVSFQESGFVVKTRKKGLSDRNGNRAGFFIIHRGQRGHGANVSERGGQREDEAGPEASSESGRSAGPRRGPGQRSEWSRLQ